LKIVREYINEKFSDASDPIRDMGIGIKSWDDLKAGDTLQITDYINNDHPIGAYIYIINIAHFRTGDIQLDYEQFYDKKPFMKRGWRIGDNYLKTHFRIVHPSELKESINEKFTKEGDPIEDMGVGIKTQFDKWIKEIKEKDTQDISIYSPDGLLRTCVSLNKIEFIDYVVNTLKANINFDDGSPLRIAAFKHHYDIGLLLLKMGADIKKSKAFSKFWHHTDTLFGLNKLEKLYKEQLHKNVNEKFSDDFDDPIEDMGIGGYAFSTLKPGAVITAIVPGLAINRNDTGSFTSEKAGINVRMDYPLIVVSVRNYIIPGHKEIKLHKPNDADASTVNAIRQSIKNGQIPTWGNNLRLIINEKKFHSKFKVVERGF
jgi:hypothetical protein